MHLSVYDDPEIARLEKEIREHLQLVQEVMSEASFRSIGGMRTEDQKFANTVYDLLRDTMNHLSHVEKVIDNIHLAYQNEIDIREDENGRLAGKLGEIEAWVQDQRRLERIMDIIND
jgi:Mg2+ and Co2+ transporter CorA